MKNQGYSGTPLVRKLGIKEGFKVGIVNKPPNYNRLLSYLPEKVRESELGKRDLDFVQLFVTNRSECKKLILETNGKICKNGVIWVSWPKKASKIQSDLDENIIRDIALMEVLVDVKVIAIDKIWSGLKLVYRLKDR